MTTPETEIPEFISMVWGSSEILVIGETYAFLIYRYGAGPAHTIYTPVKITGKAPRGFYGDRVTCSDGINRYQGGDYRGKFRGDQYGPVLTHKRNPAFCSSTPALVQLEFDF